MLVRQRTRDHLFYDDNSIDFATICTWAKVSIKIFRGHIAGEIRSHQLVHGCGGFTFACASKISPPIFCLGHLRMQES